MKRYLFLFTLGPVQSFIAQARKTQDLYAGSFLLSYLIDSTMKKLSPQLNCGEFIFPHKTIKSKPNRFIATIESDDIAKIGKELKEYVRKEFQLITTNVLSNLDLDAPDGLESQIKTHLQVNWVAIPLDEDDYAGTYKELESYLGAIKNVRKFQQLEETGRKCSLCGERNVLFYRLTDEEKKKGGLKVRQDGLLKKLYVKEKEVVFFDPEKKRDNLKFQKGEGLCAVCFTKRFTERYFEERLEYNYTKHFPSTAEIAAMEWLSKIPDKEKRDYKAFFKDFDAQLFYEENLEKKYLEKYNYFKDDNSLKKAKQKLKEFYDIKSDKDKNRDKELGKPSKYYALLMLDGDNMGKWLSGEFLENENELEEFHKELSKALGDYADKVESIIQEQEPKGKLVYTGGDDVLAFVNLNHLLSVMKELRAKFPKFEEFGFGIKDNKKSSASAGIAIAHYKTPLSEVLKWAKKMEHEAKEDGDRDAFAIAVLKRSGEIRKAMFKWQYDKSSSIEILEYLIKSLKPGEFSNKFINSLGVEFRRLMDEEGKYEDKDIIKKIIKTEMKRLIARSCRLERKNNETKKDFDERKKHAIGDLTKKLDRLHTNSKSLDNFLSALDIADFIERGGTK